MSGRRARAVQTPFYLAERRATPIRSAGDGRAGLAAPHVPRPRPTGSFTIPRIPSRPRAARSAAIPKSFPGGRSISAPVEKRRDVLVYTTAPLARIWKSPDRCAWCCTCRLGARIRISPPSWWTCFPRSARATSPMASCGCDIAIPWNGRCRATPGYRVCHHDRCRSDRQRVSSGAIGSASRSRAAIFRASTATPILAVKSPTNGSCGRRPSGSTATACTPRMCCYR